MRGISFRGCGAVVLTSGAVAVSAHAQTTSVDLQASADNSIYSENSGNSNGKGPSIFAGANAGSEPRRALVRFDLDGKVPPHAHVVTATLTLHLNRTSSDARPIFVHRLLTSWGEGASNAGDPGGAGIAAQPGDATWSHRFWAGLATNWTTPGGDFDSKPSASASVNGIGFYSWSSTALAGDVAGWLADSSRNFGWIIKGEEPEFQTAKRFDSRESTTASFRPVLKVVYSCPSDFNHDGFVNGNDLDQFVAAFELGDSAADFNGDGFVNGDDFDAFIINFVEGC